MKIVDYKNLDETFYATQEIETLENVKKIIDDVKNNGDLAVKNYTKQFDNVILEPEKFEVSEQEVELAFKNIEPKTKEAIEFAIQNVKVFSENQLKCFKNLDMTLNNIQLGHKIIPIEKAGCYVPGGNYPLLSSAIMSIVPAKIAGVKKIMTTSPKIHPLTIVAAKLSGADKIYKIGGVQAIAALAYGTETIDNVDIITGPGNKYVMAAKKYIFGKCGIDFLAGPSEVMIIADNVANPEFVAADMLAQCEHDRDARAYLICFDKNFAQKVQLHVEKMLEKLSTQNIAKYAFEQSFAILVNSVDEAVFIANKKAPEHLEICLKDNSYNDKFINYGSLFIGNYSAEVFGDYISGTNHILPTNQVARYSGGLSVLNYLKIQTYQKIDKNFVNILAQNASILADNEGLQAHKNAADIRMQ